MALGGFSPDGSGGGGSPDWASPGAIGATTPNSGSFTTILSSGLVSADSLSVANSAQMQSVLTLGRTQSYGSTDEYTFHIGHTNETAVNSGRTYSWEFGTAGNANDHNLMLTALKRGGSNIDLVELDGTPATIKLGGVLRPFADSTTSFQFQNAAGTSDVIRVDTVNEIVNIITDAERQGVNLVSANASSAPGFLLQNSGGGGNTFVQFWAGGASTSSSAFGLSTDSVIFRAYPDNNGSGGSFGIGTGNAKDFLLCTNNTERLRIDSLGNVIIETLPTSDPAVAGTLWNDSGTVKISAG